MSMVDTVYVMSGGDFFRAAFNGVATLIGSSTWASLFHIVGFLSAMALFFVYISKHDPKEVLKFIAVFLLITSVLIIPKRTVHIIDMTNPTGVYRVDNVPVGLAVPFRFITSIGASITKMYDLVFHMPDSVAYSKTGMLFGATLMANTTDVMAQNGDLAALFGDYVKQCVIGDIMLSHKYSMQELMDSTDPYALIFRRPSPLRGVIVPYGNSLATPGFYTCEALARNVLQPQMNVDTSPGGKTWDYYVKRFIGPKPSANTLFSQLMGDSYQFYYQGGKSASDILRQNVVTSAVRQGIKSYTAESGNAANLVNLASESSNSKMRLSWAASGGLAATFTPVMHTVLMALLVGMFPIIILLATIHSLTMPVLKGYIFSLVYLQSWPPLYAILNYAMAFYLQGQTRGINFSLANMATIQQTHSDIGLMAAWLSNSIPFIAAGLVFGLWRVVSQAGNYLGTAINSTASSSASQAADGTWAFNNMQMENVSSFKWDTNQSFRNGQMTTQHASGATSTQTQGGQQVYDNSGSISRLPTDIQFGQMVSSGYQQQQREAESQVRSLSQSISQGSNLTSSLLNQWSQQRGNSDTLSQGADRSQSTSLSQAQSKLNNVVSDYARRNGISNSEALTEVLSKSQDMSFGVGAKGYGRIDTDKQLIGKLAAWGTGYSIGGEAHIQGDYTGRNGSSHGMNSDLSNRSSYDKGLSAQEAKDVRESMDTITSHRAIDNSSHTQNASNSLSEQVASNLSQLSSNIKQYNDALNRSSEYAQMASYAENNSATITSNYAQEFVGYVHQSAPAQAERILTDASRADVRAEREQLARQFVDERLKPQLESEFRQSQVRAAGGMGDVGLPAGMGNDLAQAQQHQAQQMADHASASGVQEAGGIRQQVRDARQQTDSQIAAADEKVAESKQQIQGEYAGLHTAQTEQDRRFGEAQQHEQERQSWKGGFSNANDKLQQVKGQMKGAGKLLSEDKE
ncbi:conjugal transfer mating pair stabilization protein TraG (plasmid) [Edwardsiella tarda]|uniref:conjugal transfer mating-pair stabilization protein TraG n=1 Tax=Edwardsiella tarda TaxID=636 RepID=UPI000D507760|nr:conjugal transfer mating-pair stabilization protein TraG [Edwardsiella tarda]UCQ29576.1 conjugal transfer mating pair stabilization protein TraG [Edwardsiella tarda]